MGPTHLPQLQDSSLGSIDEAETLNRLRCPIHCAWRIVCDLSVNTKSAKYYQLIQVADRVELFLLPPRREGMVLENQEVLGKQGGAGDKALPEF